MRISDVVLQRRLEGKGALLIEVNALAKDGVSITEDVVNKALVIVTGGVK